MVRYRTYQGNVQRERRVKRRFPARERGPSLPRYEIGDSRTIFPLAFSVLSHSLSLTPRHANRRAERAPLVTVGGREKPTRVIYRRRGLNKLSRATYFNRNPDYAAREVMGKRAVISRDSAA